MNKDLLILLGLTGLGLYFIFRNRSSPTPSLHRSFRTLQPVRRQTGSPSSYKNTETMDIKWNSDGLPVKVVIHRDAVTNG